jgi:hypothetical protein
VARLLRRWSTIAIAPTISLRTDLNRAENQSSDTPEGTVEV